MRKADLKILIVEDDITLGKAFEEAVQRAGYTPTLCTNADSAAKAFKVSDYRAVIMDCMLPGKNGVDLSQDLRKEINGDFLLILTSGIFKDKAYIRDSLKKTDGVSYLTKPFNMNDVIDILDEHLGDEFETERDPLFEILSTKNISPQDRVKAISSTPNIHGFDLPYIFTLLMDSGFTGNLKLEYPEGKTSEVGYDRGRIDKVFHPDTESYFGVLLVENGFTSHQEVEESLAQQNDKPIGQRLIDSDSLSPHAISIVQHQQMIIRLSKTIQDTSISISIEEESPRGSQVAIENFQFTPLLNDWISSKLDGDWLKAFYLSWLENPIVEGPEKAKLSLMTSLPLIREAPVVLELVDYPKSLQEVLDSQDDQSEDQILKAFHFLLLQRVLVFGNRSRKPASFDKKVARLEKIKKAMSMQNHFEVLGLSKEARPSEIERSYKELAKALHPDKLPPGAPDNLVELAKDVFSRVSTAYQQLKDSEKKRKYLNELQHGIAEDVLKAESMFDDGVKHINAGRYREAFEILAKASEIKGHRTDLMVYLLWAKIKSGRGRQKFDVYFGDIRKILSRIPHEERHSPVFFFVRGLYYVVKQDYRKAKAFFKHASALDPYFIEAKRELSSLRKKMQSKGRGTQVTDDLSQVVTRMFRSNKKKKRRSG